MVSKVCIPNIVSENARTDHQWKIYAKPNEANFRRFNRIANTCNLSTAANFDPNCDKSQRFEETNGVRDVLPASHGILARARARAAAQGQDAGVG